MHADVVLGTACSEVAQRFRSIYYMVKASYKSAAIPCNMLFLIWVLLHNMNGTTDTMPSAQ